jgi:hypothetical protein
MEPLTLEQMAEVVSIRSDDRSLDESGIATDLMDLAACCGSLVTVRTQDTSFGQYDDLRGPRVNLITLAHASVEEYLKSGKIGRGLSSVFHMDITMVHHELAKTCLQYVGFEDFKRPMEHPVSLKSVMARPLFKLIELQKEIFSNRQAPDDSLQILRSNLRERTAQYALADYACRYWLTHLRQSRFSDSPDEDTIRLLEWFIHSEDYQGNYVSWQQMYHHDVIWYCHNRPPLFYAIDFKIDSLVKLLLPKDADLDKMPPESPNGNWPQTPLHVAARCGALEIVQLLIQRGASIEIKSGPTARSLTPLHFAAEGGHADVIKFLLESGASPHSRSESESTPFYRAARSGSLKALRVLYDAGSDINSLTWDKFTPLFEAVAHGRSRTANQLLEWGADPTIVNGMGESTLKLLKRSRNLEARKKGKPLVTEDDILDDIKRIQAAGGSFTNYIKDEKPQYVIAMSIEMDTRPGSEREKDYRWSRDVSLMPHCISVKGHSN